MVPPRPVIGILHPGAMGAAVGAALKPAAGAVIWAAAGRSITTSKRAEAADLIGVPDVAALARRADVIISVCPPDAARAVAEEVAAALAVAPLAGLAADSDGDGDAAALAVDPAADLAADSDGDLASRACSPRRPLYVDANAVSPATVGAIAELLGHDRVVDGAIIGPPAWEPGRTAIWLAGPAAATVAAFFAGSPFAAHVLDGPVGAASALKACFALQSKALPAVWAALDAAARAYGIEHAVREELTRFGVDLDGHLERLTAQATGKAWRWVGEMREAGTVFAAAGLPDGFSRAAAELYERMAAADPTDLANPWGLRGPDDRRESHVPGV